MLSAGTNVVMDFPANTLSQRDWFRSIFSEIEAPHNLVYIDLSNEVCLKQIEKRRKEQPERMATDTPDDSRTCFYSKWPRSIEANTKFMVEYARQFRIDIVVGIVCAFIGRFVVEFLTSDEFVYGFDLTSFVVSVLGA